MQRSVNFTHSLNEFRAIKALGFILLILFVISFRAFSQPNDTVDIIHKIKMFLRDVCLSTNVTEGVIAILPIRFEPYQITHETNATIEPIEHEGRQFIITENINLQTVKITYSNNTVNFSDFLNNLNGKLVLLKLDVDSIAIDTFRIQAKPDTTYVVETITNEKIHTPIWWDNKRYLNVPFLSSLALTAISGSWYLIKRSEVNDLYVELENAPNIASYNNSLEKYNLAKKERDIAQIVTAISGTIFGIILIKDTFFRHSKTVEVARQKTIRGHSNLNNSNNHYNRRVELIPTIEKEKFGISIRF